MDKVKDSLQPLKQFADNNMELTYAFAAIGLGLVAIKASRALCSAYRYLLRPSHDLAYRYGSNWAVVTGATDGIGKALAFELARRGFKVGLVARNSDKLEEVAQEIRVQYGVEVKTVVFDFNTHYSEQKIGELAGAMQVFDKVSVLVNNVGTASYDPLVQMKDSDIHKQLNVNVVGTTVFTKLMIPKLLLNDHRSAILFIASGAAVLSPHPNVAVYAATKSYVYQLGVSVSEEHKDKIDTTVVNTAHVKSNMNSGRYLFTITPEEHAKHALDKLGHDVTTIGHYKHALGTFLSNQYGTGALISYINSQRRKQFLAERAQQQKK